MNEFIQYFWRHCEQNLTSQGSNKCDDATNVNAGVWAQYARIVQHIFKYNNKNIIEHMLTLGISLTDAVPVGSVVAKMIAKGPDSPSLSESEVNKSDGNILLQMANGTGRQSSKVAAVRGAQTPGTEWIWYRMHWLH